MADDKSKATEHSKEDSGQKSPQEGDFEIAVNLLITKKGREKPQVKVRVPEPGTAI